MNLCINILFYGCKVEQSGNLQHNGMINSEIEMYSGSKEFCFEYMEASSFKDGNCTTQRVRSTAVLFLKII